MGTYIDLLYGYSTPPRSMATEKNRMSLSVLSPSTMHVKLLSVQPLTARPATRDHALSSTLSLSITIQLRGRVSQNSGFPAPRYLGVQKFSRCAM